ncbi:MAG: AraC family transcriptional regulator [Pseudomonadota bacterium]
MNVTRAIALKKVVDVFRVAGTPVDRELARARLPEGLEESPNEYISTILGYRFIQKCQEIERISDLGWHSFRSLEAQDFGGTFTSGMRSCKTLNERLVLLCDVLHSESNYLRCHLLIGSKRSRFVFQDPHLDCASDYSISEWSRVFYVIRAIQMVLGGDWRPLSIGFVSTFSPSVPAHEYFRGIPLLTGQKTTWVEFPSAILPTCTGEVSEEAFDRPAPETQMGSQTTAELLRKLLHPYLCAGRPSVEVAAEMAGMSSRSLQRLLRREGVSFSTLLDQCSFERACRLLGDHDLRITDIAHSVGYEDSSHFARAFKRISGQTPRQYRRGRALADSAAASS